MIRMQTTTSKIQTEIDSKWF